MQNITVVKDMENIKKYGNEHWTEFLSLPVRERDSKWQDTKGVA